jgi:hypothetical protein
MEMRSLNFLLFGRIIIKCKSFEEIFILVMLQMKYTKKNPKIEEFFGPK